MKHVFLKFIGPSNSYRPEFGPNADWDGDDASEVEERIKSGWWVEEPADGLPVQSDATIQEPALVNKNEPTAEQPKPEEEAPEVVVSRQPETV
jgi:hypothetical protein